MNTPQAERTPAGAASLILVVDDDQDNREVLARRLKRDGHEVISAADGRSALECAAGSRPDLILLDIVMPEMDGLAVLETLKHSPDLRDIPVIMISALDEIDSVVRSIELGADDYLTKPFNSVLLRARIGALLERKRLRDAERKRQVDIEAALADADRQRRIAESLLLNILPARVAEELQVNGSVEPMYFEDVTIAFSDFVGFTLATERLPAEDLVSLLHAYFSAFDAIMDRYGLEKLKTVGDSYMFGGGLPDRSASHPVDVLLAAQEMLGAVKGVAEQRGIARWPVRIGIHTGPVVAGVVGVRKFAFDVWGDTVNFSSRLEAASTPDEINISGATYARVKDFFDCRKRGRVKTKEGRSPEMYFVSGLASSLMARDAANPMAGFLKRYRTYYGKDLAVLPQMA